MKPQHLRKIWTRLGCLLFVVSSAGCRKNPDAGKASTPKPSPPPMPSTTGYEKLGITIPLSPEHDEFLTFMTEKLMVRASLPAEEVKKELEKFCARVGEPPEQVAVELMFAIVRFGGSSINTNTYPLYEITRSYGKAALPWLWNRLERDGFKSRFGRKFLGLIDSELGIPETLRQLKERMDKAPSAEKRADWQAAYDYLAQFAPR